MLHVKNFLCKTMYRQTYQQDLRSLLIDTQHMAIIQDTTWLGMDVHQVTDLNLLIDWWNKTILFAADQKTREINDAGWQRFHSALWIRINALHPKYLLKFDDITKPELLKKVA